MQETGLDTKSRIFYASLRLFAIDGVENTTTRGIADAAGIKCASIYNHYKSKDDILRDCYQYFVDNHEGRRLTKEQYLPILQSGTKDEVIHIPSSPLPEDIYENFVYSAMVLCSRIYMDKRAREIYTDIINNASAYLNEFFETGIAIGRFDRFDYHTLCHAYICIKLISAHMVSSVVPTDNTQLLEDQAKMISILVGLIPFRY